MYHVTHSICAKKKKSDLYKKRGAYNDSIDFLGGSVVKNLPALQETWAWSLGQEDCLEKEMATHSNMLAWEIPWAEESGGLQSMWLQKSDMTKSLNHHIENKQQGKPKNLLYKTGTILNIV